MEYKTLRYPGHARIMEAIRELGLLDLKPIDVKGMKVVPRDLVVAAIGPRLTKPDAKDLVALRVFAEGIKDGKPKKIGWEMVDFYDENYDISAMERSTGFSLSITGQMQARGEIGKSGVFTPDEAVPAEKYISELGKRGVEIKPLR
jgi:lysine 6-dehydrogenase